VFLSWHGLLVFLSCLGLLVGLLVFLSWPGLLVFLSWPGLLLGQLVFLWIQSLAFQVA